MKKGSDNLRQSVIQGVIERVKIAEINEIIYELVIEEDELDGLHLIKKFDKLNK